MSGKYTLPGVMLSGTHASRPAASAVAQGALYFETDTGQAYQSDGSSTWTAFGAPSTGIADHGAFTYLDATDGSAPADPAAGHARIYSKAGRIYSRDSSGTEYGPFDAAGGGGASLSDFRLSGVKDAPGDLALGAYGDELEYTTYAGLTAVWTAHNVPTDSDGSSTLYPIACGSSVMFPSWGTAGKKSVLERAITVPTNCEIAVLVSGLRLSDTMFGCGFVDDTGAGYGCSVYGGGYVYGWTLSGWGYSGSASHGTWSDSYPLSRKPYWLALRKLGTAYRIRISRDATTWETMVSGETNSTTMKRILIGNMWENSNNVDLNGSFIHRVVYGDPDLGLG